MKKIILYTAMAAFALQAAVLVSQESLEENIQLPTVTTVVTGDSMTAGENAVPDFELILPANDTNASALPELPEASAVKEEDDVPQGGSSAPAKTIFAEGVVGAGYKGFYTGDFSVYKSGTVNPFKINFATENKEGNHSFTAADGFFDRFTKLSASSTLNAKENLVNEASISYTTSTEGFQSLISDFYDNNKSLINGSDSFTFKFAKKWFINLAADASYYERYAGLTGNKGATLLAQEKKSDVYRYSPLFAFGYGSREDDGFNFDINASYTESAFITNAVLDSTASAYSKKLATKLKTGADFGFKNKFLSINADGYFVMNSSHFASEITRQYMPSFDVLFDIKLLSSLSPRIMNVSLKGGLLSQLPEYSELESAYKYAYLNFIPGETSDWYAVFDLSLPVGNSFTVDAGASWYMTAFGNGLWEPDYTDSSKGFFGYKQNDRMEINSALKLSYSYKLLTLGLAWNAYWDYVPVLEAPQNICLNIDVQSEKGTWGINLAAKENLGSYFSPVPVIDFSAFMMAGKSARFTIKLEDAVMFFKPDGSRKYAGTNYITNQDRLSILLKFFF